LAVEDHRIRWKGSIGRAIAVDGIGAAFVAGKTTSDERWCSFPVRNGRDVMHNGGHDAFVAEVAPSGKNLVQCRYIRRTVTLSRMDDPALPYQIASSLGDGPTWIGVRTLGLSVDGLFLLLVSRALPRVFSGYADVLDWKGRAQASIRIPNHSSLLGLLVRSAFVTLHASAPDGVYSISDPVAFQIVGR